MLVKTSALTRGERLLIKRRRTGESQVEAAARFGVSLYNYRQWETDTLKAPHKLGLGTLEPFEACFITRRRTERSAADVAKAVGVSRWWFCQMERGDVDATRLVSFWRGA